MVTTAIRLRRSVIAGSRGSADEWLGTARRIEDLGYSTLLSPDGVGLHAYGFNKTLADGLAIFWATQIVCIGLGLIPTRHWRSFGQVKAEPTLVVPESPTASRKGGNRRDQVTAGRRR